MTGDSVDNNFARASRAQFTRDSFPELDFLGKFGMQILAVAVPEKSRRKLVISKHRRPFPARTLEPIPQVWYLATQHFSERTRIHHGSTSPVFVWWCIRFSLPKRLEVLCSLSPRNDCCTGRTRTTESLVLESKEYRVICGMCCWITGSSWHSPTR